MGGTSTDVCLVLGGQPAPAAEREVAGLPGAHAVARRAHHRRRRRLDRPPRRRRRPARRAPQRRAPCPGRPATAAAAPSPPSPTPTSWPAASPPAPRSPGSARSTSTPPERALDAAGVSAEGVLAVVDAAMEEAIRVVTVERGVDPRGLALVAFGGAGPLHACALAEALDMAAVIVPARAGVLSAVGILGAPLQVDLVRSMAEPARPRRRAGRRRRAPAGGQLVGGAQPRRPHRLVRLHQLRRRVRARPGVPGAGEALTWRTTTLFDCRYAGPEPRAPGAATRRRSTPSTTAATATPAAATRSRSWPCGPGPRCRRRCARPTCPRPTARGAVGPAVIAEPDCTIWVPEGWPAEPGAAGALVLRRSAAP